MFPTTKPFKNTISLEELLAIIIMNVFHKIIEKVFDSVHGIVQLDDWTHVIKL